MTMKRVAGQIIVALAVWITACEHRCPVGYDKRDGTCYKIHDAGPDGATPGGGEDGDAEVVDAAADLDSAAAEDTADDGGASSACDLACAEHETCLVMENVPTCACEDGYDACERKCTDLASDPANCGSCGYACEAGLSCKDGACEQKIRELVLGGESSCALYDSSDGRYPIKCWGDTSNKLFRDVATQALTPRNVVGVPAVRMMAVDSNKQCVVLPDRDVVRCWGLCGKECGNTGTVALSDTFFDNTVNAVVDIHASTIATCAHSGLGLVRCWGASFMIGSDVDQGFPAATMIAGHDVVSSVSLAGTHGCILTRDKKVACWGTEGRLSIGSSADAEGLKRGLFVKSENGTELSAIVQVHSGQLRNCAVASQGTLWCWGDNGSGMVGSFVPGALGTGDRVEHDGAVQVPLSDVASVAVGWWHTCAIARSGQAYCWGFAPLTGQGDGVRNGDADDAMLVTSPVAVPGLSDVVELKVGENHSCARRRSGQVVCWGDNQKGQIGDGTTISRFSPTPVLNLYESHD